MILGYVGDDFIVLSDVKSRFGSRLYNVERLGRAATLKQGKTCSIASEYLSALGSVAVLQEEDLKLLASIGSEEKR